MSAAFSSRRPPLRWVLPPPPENGSAARLAAALHLPEVVCRLLCQRGYAEPESAKRFLRPRLDALHDPSGLLGMDRAVERLAAALRGRELIVVHGDYDVDGVCSTVLLVRVLRALGGYAVPFIPRRLEDGYDLGPAGIQAALAAGARVLVTCDCGTSAREPVADACAAGLDVIITDHHLPGGALPSCIAVINPKRDGCRYADRDLAGVGVAFKLGLALSRAMGLGDEPVMAMLDLVALATIADVAPLRGENRVLARYGLRVLEQTRNVGLRALIRAAGLEGKPLTAGRVGFVLAPRINAVGRLGHALRAVELLLTESEDEAMRIARELEELNRRRQELDRATLASVAPRLAAMDLDATYGVVLADPGWHPGVIGIAASRLVEELCRPVVLIALEGEVGKGSGRSTSRFDLHAGLAECRSLLHRFGGHRAAAGLTIERRRVEEFAECFNEVARQRLTADDLVPELRVDLEIGLEEITPDLEALLRHFEPFGPSNAAPVLAVRAARLARAPRVVGDGHLRVALEQGNTELPGIGWGLGPRAADLDSSRPVDVAFRLERDEWKGTSRLQARLADVRH